MILERLGSRSDLFGSAGMRSALHIVSKWKKWTVHVWMIGQKLGIIIFNDLLGSTAPRTGTPTRNRTGSTPEKYLSFKVRSVDTRPCANIHDWLSKMDSICAVTISWHRAENLHDTDALFFVFIGNCDDVMKLLWPQVANKLGRLWRSCMCVAMWLRNFQIPLYSLFHYVVRNWIRNWIPWCSWVTVCFCLFSPGVCFLGKGAQRDQFQTALLWQ